MLSAYSPLAQKRRGTGGRESGKKGTGGVRGTGEEGAQSGILKVKGSGRNRENNATLCNIWQSKNRKEAGANKNRAGTGMKGYGEREM